jgi:hypothetical protein
MYITKGEQTVAKFQLERIEFRKKKVYRPYYLTVFRIILYKELLSVVLNGLFFDVYTLH